MKDFASDSARIASYDVFTQRALYIYVNTCVYIYISYVNVCVRVCV